MIHFRYDRVKSLILKKFGGTSSGKIVEAWPVQFKPRSRWTIRRWVENQTVPLNQIIPLAATLDVDPVALFECTSEEYSRTCVSLMQDVASAKPRPLAGQLKWAYRFIAPSQQWPPETLSREYYERAWFTFDFSHSAATKQNFYQRLMLSANLRPDGEPQAWHFAFRSPGPLHSLWRPYGIVVRDSGKIRLYHCRGSIFETNLSPNELSFPVENWFGSGAAQFRIASLHRFRAVIMDRWDESVSCLRFP